MARSERLSLIRRGLVIPAHPLALLPTRKLDERRQRALTRYYIDAGAGGIAVGDSGSGRDRRWFRLARDAGRARGRLDGDCVFRVWLPSRSGSDRVGLLGPSGLLLR